jgi:hypothetical protein
MQGITDLLLLASCFAGLGQHSQGAVTQRPLLPQLPACERACVLALARRVFVYMLETLSFQLLEPLPITNTAPMPK